MSAEFLKFLVDVGVGRHVESYLAQQGHDVKTVRSIDPQLPDDEIIRFAYSEKRIVITMDKDFGELVYQFAKEHCGVMLLRLEDADGSKKVEVVSQILHHHSEHLQNSFCVFQHGKLRIRRKRV